LLRFLDSMTKLLVLNFIVYHVLSNHLAAESRMFANPKRLCGQ